MTGRSSLVATCQCRADCFAPLGAAFLLVVAPMAAAQSGSAQTSPQQARMSAPTVNRKARWKKR